MIGPLPARITSRTCGATSASGWSKSGFVEVSEDVARRTGEFARSYRRSHSGIGVVDYLLAGTVSVVGADLVTINVRHFPRFKNLHPPYAYGAPEQRRTGH